MRPKHAQLIVALDVDTLEEVRHLQDILGNTVSYYKVGSQLFTACGPAVVRFLAAKGKKVFLDLKYHDIPNTVAHAVRAAVGLRLTAEDGPADSSRRSAGSAGVFMYTLHTCGGVSMMQAAVAAAREVTEKTRLVKPLALGVTVLTSEKKEDNIEALVLQRAHLARQAGLDGVVASCHEARLLRQEFGDDFVIVTPGIRPSGEDVHDQQRVVTPVEAVKSGSDFLVVGRPIIKAADPYQTVKKILAEMEAARRCFPSV
jgi:orotidine-5'-phosphate decarboxylase